MAPKRQPQMPRIVRIALLLAIAVLISFWILMAGNVTMKMSKRRETVSMMMALDTAAVSYTTDNGPLPKNLDNHTLWADLSGADSGKVYMSFKTSQMNDKGEIVDPWGTPLHVAVGAGGNLQMRSAADDKIFGTQDDITAQ